MGKKVSLLYYTDMRFEAQDKAVVAALAAQEKQVAAALEAKEKYSAMVQQFSQRAIDKAEQNTNEWKASANEWRDAMKDRESEFFKSREAEQRLGVISKDIVDLKLASSGSNERRQGGSDVWKMLAGVAAIVFAAAAAVAAYLK